jgi:hypothetical protein
MSRPAPRQQAPRQQAPRQPRPGQTDRRGALAALAVAGVGVVLIAVLSLALDAVLAARLRAGLAQAPAVTPARPVTLPQLTRWECLALTGGMWVLPLAPQLSRLPLPPGVVASPDRGHCGGGGYSPVTLTIPLPGP